MESIWIFDFSFMPLLIIHDYFSVNWELYLNEVGTFEMHSALSDEVTSVLKGHSDLLVVQGDKQAVLTGFRLAEECVIYGRTCNWLLTGRITPPYALTSNTAEKMCRQLVADAFADTPEMQLGSLIEEGELMDFEQVDDATLFEAVKGCLEREKAGHIVSFDVNNKKWSFQVIYGKKRSLVLSEDNRNIYDSVYTEDCLDCCDGVWYYQEQEKDSEGKQPEPVRTYVSREDSHRGILRREFFSREKTELLATEELNKKKRNRSVTGKLKNLRYGADYNLGDRILLQVEKGGFLMEEEKQVVGVHLWFEAENVGEEPIFI